MQRQIRGFLSGALVAGCVTLATTAVYAQDPALAPEPTPAAPAAPAAPATPAQATTVDPLDAATVKVIKPFRVKLGAFFPSDGDVRDSVGDIFFSYGVSYDFLKTRSTKPLLISAYLDGYNRSDEGNRLNTIGIGPAVRYYFSPVVDAPTRFYGGAGLGLYFVNAKASGGDSDNGTQFGGKLFGGAEFGPGFFGELDYTFVSEFEDINPGGFNLSIGYRF